MLAFYYDHIHLFSASIVFLFSIYLFLNRHVHKSVFSLFLFSITVTIWQIDLFGLIRSETIESIFVWRRFPRVATMLLAPMMLQFVYSLTSRNMKSWFFIGSFSMGTFFALYRFIFYHHEIYNQKAYFWTPDITPLLIGYFFFTYGLFFVALGMLFQKYRNTQDLVFKKQLMYTFIALFSFVFFNLDILPVVFDGERIHFIGSLAAIFFFILTSYAITRHDLFDIRLVITGTSARLIQSILEKLVKVFDRKTLFKTLAKELTHTLEIQVINIVLSENGMIENGITQLGEHKGLVPNPKNIQQMFFPIFSSSQLEGYFVLDNNQNLRSNTRTLLLVQNQLIPLLDRIHPYEKIKVEYQATLKQLDDVKWQLARSEKIATLARTAELCHHEVRTPISVMQLCLTNLSKSPNKEEIDEYRHDVQAQLDRVSYIVDTSLTISSKQLKNKESLYINNVIKQSIDLIPISGFRVETTLSKTPTIQGLPGDLISVFTNLISNSKKAMPDGGILTISTSFDTESNQAVVLVKDTGHGIEQDHLEKIWEPYFTTDITDGHGLGLSLVHQIIQDHNGSVTVKSEVNMGTEFKILFPTEKEHQSEVK